ncbi:MAG: hypothetical protein NUV51_03980 [Sulfuricaulis sp.]|nr:hypothetical protein [Sulfuricaulis sp.]
MYYTDHYIIDWDSVQTLDDIKLLIAAVQIAFEPDHPRITSIMHLVRLVPKSASAVTMD